jgi:aminopeptidase N
MLAQACERLVAGSSPGDSRQLAAARGLIGATVDTGRLRGWLDGVDVPAGLAVDTDLRWLILYRLVVLGAAGPEQIAAESAGDRSAAGEQWAARCAAAVPDPAAKARAWAAITSDTSLSNRLVEANAAGFWQPEQLDLTAGYVERYFAEMPAALAPRAASTAENVAVTAYPRYAVDVRTRRLAADLLAAPDCSPLLHRVLTDADDDMRRALAARG